MATEWQNPPNADVILRASGAGGKEFHAHKLVLSLASSVFRDMLSAPLLSTETNPPGLPIIDVHDPPEVLEIFLQIIYPVRNPPIGDLETLASVFKLADKYDASALLDAHHHYFSSPCLYSSPIHTYAVLRARGRGKGAEAIARKVSFASLESLSGPLLRLMTLEHHHQLVQFIVARDKKMREIVGRHKLGLVRVVDSDPCSRKNDALHRAYSTAVVTTLQAAFEADPCVRTTEAVGLVFNLAVPPPSCGESCIFRPKKLQERAEGLLGELVKMAKTLPWKGQGAQVN